MTNMDNLLVKVEKRIILEGIRKELISVQEGKVVPLREGKLSSTEFGKFLGKSFDCFDLLAINYYGHFKLSNGIDHAVASVNGIFPGVRSILAGIVHFNSIRTEAAREIAGDDKDLFIDYVEFKKYLLDLRFGREKEKLK
jgi:hypothetical protein